MIISVIIPTYNRSEMVKEAVESVLRQTYQDFEVLVVDDFSEDNTRNVIESFSDSRVKYLLNQHAKGAQGARNTGLYAANGEWVAMLDSDDLWLPRKLELQLNYLSKTRRDLAGLGCVNTYQEIVLESSNIDVQPEREATYTPKDLLYKNYVRGLSGFMFRRQDALDVGGFDERFPAMQDLDLFVALSLKGSIHVMPEVLVKLRRASSDRISSNYSHKLAAAYLFHEKYRNEIDHDIVLKNRAISRKIMYHFLTNGSVKYLDWLVLGCFVDFGNFKNLLRQIASVVLKKHLVKVITGVRFQDGIEQEDTDNQDAA